MSNEKQKKQRKTKKVEAWKEARETEIAPVIEIIERAFDGVPPPDKDHRTLFQAEAWDDYKKVDQSKDHLGRWQDLPDSHIEKCTYALPHLDSQGMHYYLPALICHYLRSQRLRGSHHSLLFTLEPSTGDLKTYQRKRFKPFTFEQREAILAFLEFIDGGSVEAWRRVVALGDNAEWFRKFY